MPPGYDHFQRFAPFVVVKSYIFNAHSIQLIHQDATYREKHPHAPGAPGSSCVIQDCAEHFPVFWSLIAVMVRLMTVLALLPWPGFAQSSNTSHPWDSVFQASWTARTHGEIVKARELTARAWNLVKVAGPVSPGYSDGVELAYATAIVPSGPLRAESFYAEALKAAQPAKFRAVRLQILLRMAFRFMHSEEVKAKRLYEEALALATSITPRPRFYGRILNNLAELEEKMGNPAEAARLRFRAGGEPTSEPLPYPIFGMEDDPNAPPPTDLSPDIKRLVVEAQRLIFNGEYEQGDRVANQCFALAETYPQVAKIREITYFYLIALAFNQRGRTEDAARILQRDLALSEKAWGPNHPALASAMLSTAWTYINLLRQLKPAHELVERAALAVIASSGAISDEMRSVEEARMRLAELENDPAAVSEHAAKMRQLWVAVHGENTKPLVIE